jgi:hypothetical protein
MSNFASPLKFSATLNRLIRQDEPAQLGAPTRPLLEAAVRAGRPKAALEWLDYYLLEFEQIWYIFGVWNWHMVRFYLERQGDQAWAHLLDRSMAPWLGATAAAKSAAAARVEVTGHDARLLVPEHSPEFHLTEGHQRYDLTLDTPDAQKARWESWRAAITAAIRAGDMPAFTQLLDSYLVEARLIHDVICDWAWALLTFLAAEWGEAVLGEVLRVTEEPWVTVRYEKLRELSVGDSLQLTIEGMRGHFSGPGRAGTISVVEETDRYVLAFDACGTGGRMRRGDPLVGSGSRLDPPYNFLNIQGAYDWTWNRKGVCAYCAHCAVVNQILPIEGLGRPMRMTEYPDKPTDACRWIIYKDSHGFPDQAYLAVGKSQER